jgi:hypothetical protein
MDESRVSAANINGRESSVSGYTFYPQATAAMPEANFFCAKFVHNVHCFLLGHFVLFLSASYKFSLEKLSFIIFTALIQAVVNFKMTISFSA